MFKKLVFSIFSIIVVMSCLAMETANNENNPAEQMVTINSWQDVQQFANKIVVYKAEGFLFTTGTYDIQSNESLRVGYIPKEHSEWFLGERQSGYNMKRLVKKDAPHGDRPLVNAWIELCGPIIMREADAEECKRILQALDDKKAEFDYMFFYKEELRALLNK